MISTPIIYDFAGFWNRMSGQNSREYDMLVTVQVGPRACRGGSGRADILAVTGGLGAEDAIIPDTKNQRESGNSPANAT